MSENEGYWKQWHARRTHRRRFLQLSGMTAAGAAALAAVGCGGNSSGAKTPGGGGTATTGAAGTASALPDHPLYKGLAGGKRGGKFVFTLSEDVIGADPHSHEEPSSLITALPSYNGLFFPWTEGPITGLPQIMGELVEKWEQPNNTELTLHLRKGVTFQNVAPLNGRPFTSQDVVYNMQRMRDTTRPENRLRGMFDLLQTIQAQDDYTVKMTLSQPFAPLLANLAFTWAAMVAHEVVEAGNIEKTPIGTGAFILDKWNRGTSLEWKRNPNYWKPGLPFFDQVEGQIVPDQAVRDAKLLSQELDVGFIKVLGSSKATIEKQMANVRDKISGATFIETPGAFAALLKVYGNVAVKPFDDMRVRQAISYAMPYDQMIQTYAGTRAMRTGPSSSANVPWAMRPEDLPATDVTKAKQLLSAAGYPDGFKTEAWVTAASSYGGTIIGPIIAGILKPLGIQIQLKVLQDAEWLAQVYRGQGAYPMTTQNDWSYDDPDRTLREYYSSKGSAAHQNIKDTQLDAMLEKQRTELNTKTRQVLIQDIQKYILENGYMTPLFTFGGVTAIPPWTHYPDIRNGASNSYRVRDITYMIGGPRGPAA